MSTQKKRLELRHALRNNEHEIYIVSVEEMDAIFQSSPKYPSLKEVWEKYRDETLNLASYASAGSDSLILARLMADIGIMTQVRIKHYSGKPHIIIKGHPGIRTIFTGTKYGIRNPKVLKMGLGRAGAANLAKIGGVVTIVLLTGFRVIDHLLTDQSTLSQLIGTLATDVVKVGLTIGASLAGAVVGSAFTFAIGPLAIALFFGIGTSLLLDAIDKRYDVTERVIDAMEELGETPQKIREILKEKKKRLNLARDKTVETVFDYIIDEGRSILINTARHTLNKFLRPGFK